MFLIETGLPFDDVRRLVNQMPVGDFPSQSSPELGRLGGLSSWLMSVRGGKKRILTPLIALMATTHELEDAGDLAIVQMNHISAGESVLNYLARQAGAGLQVVELGTEIPTASPLQGGELSEKECVAAMAYGMEATSQGVDLLCLDALGQTGVTVAAVCTALLGGEAADWLPSEKQQFAADIDKKISETSQDPLEVLRIWGGRDLCALVGAILAARHQQIAVILGGPLACVAALIIQKLGGTLSHCLLADTLEDKAGRALQQSLEAQQPVLSLKMAEVGFACPLVVSLLSSASLCSEVRHGG